MSQTSGGLLIKVMPMNDWLQRSTYANVSGHNLEYLLTFELGRLGLNYFVLMIIDARQTPIYQHVHGFSEHQMAVYQRHIDHDAFFHHYMQAGLLGNLMYMQQMLPVRTIRDPIFQDILVPTMELHHSHSGLVRLNHGHYLMLSSHGDARLSQRDQSQLQNVWQFLRSWGNYWLAQREMESRFAQLATRAARALPLELLTSAELSVLSLLAQGFDGSEVAKMRNVSKETVRSQIKQILHKTDCRHQNQLLSRYFERVPAPTKRWLSPPSRLAELI